VANCLLLDVSMSSHLWALQVELCVVPVVLGLFLLERRCGPYLVLATALATSLLTFAPRWGIWPPLAMNLFAFPLGMVVPTLGRRFAPALSRRAALVCLVTATAVLLTTGPYFGVYSHFSCMIEAYASLVALSLVAYRTDLPGLRCLDTRWLTRLGSAA